VGGDSAVEIAHLEIVWLVEGNEGARLRASDDGNALEDKPGKDLGESVEPLDELLVGDVGVLFSVLLT
jgi:hypothetical protein